MSKEIMIADRKCRTFINRGLHGEPIFEKTCWDTGSSNSKDPTGLVLIGLGFLIFLILILKKLRSNNSVKSNLKLLEEYVLWHSNNKDASASFGNSYQKGNFLIVQDKNGNVLDEVELKLAKYRVKGDVGDLDHLLDEYIEFYNQKNKKKADIINSKKRGDDFILCDLFNKVIKTISVDDCFYELNYEKFAKDFKKSKRDNLN